MCTTVDSTETCESFKTATNVALVGSSVCASRTDVACKLDTTNYYCVEVITTNNSCTDSGLN